MTVLNDLPTLPNFLGFVDLKSGSYVIGFACLLHVILVCYFAFAEKYVIYLLVWIPISIVTIIAPVLIYGVYKKDTDLISIWIWITWATIGYLFLSMLVVLFLACSPWDSIAVLLVISAFLWCALMVYCTFVVNSYRKAPSK